MYLTNKHVFKNLGGNCPVAPLLRTCLQLEVWHAYFFLNCILFLYFQNIYNACASHRASIWSLIAFEMLIVVSVSTNRSYAHSADIAILTPRDQSSSTVSFGTDLHPVAADFLRAIDRNADPGAVSATFAEVGNLYLSCRAVDIVVERRVTQVGCAVSCFCTLPCDRWKALFSCGLQGPVLGPARPAPARASLLQLVAVCR